MVKLWKLRKKHLRYLKTLDNPHYSDFDPIMKNIKDSTLKVILKCKNRSSILAIRTKCKCNNNVVFSFSEVSLKQIEKEISLLKLNKPQ